MKLKIILPLPPKELHPNHTVGSRNGRLGKAAKTKKYRADACCGAVACAMNANHPHHAPWKKAAIQATFFFRDKRSRDKDNLLAWLKSAFDGLQDAGIIANDSGLTFLPVEVRVDKDHPRVELEVEKQA